MYDISYMWNLKRNDTKELITNQKQTHRLKELDIRLPEGKYGEGFGIYIFETDLHIYLHIIVSKCENI